MNGVQFRLYAENLNADDIIGETTHFGINNFTYYIVDGKYKGIGEQTLIIEVIIGENWNYGIDRTRQAFKNLADYIKELNNQESVLLTEQPIKYELY